jgi:hypothetical protein
MGPINSINSWVNSVPQTYQSNQPQTYQINAPQTYQLNPPPTYQLNQLPTYQVVNPPINPSNTQNIDIAYPFSGGYQNRQNSSKMLPSYIGRLP